MKKQFVSVFMVPLALLCAEDTTWDSPIAVTSSSISVDEASIVINDSDQGLIVWASANESGQTRIESSFCKEGSWSEPIPVCDWMPYAGSAKVDFNNAGQGVAIWIQKEDATYAIVVSNYSDSTWSAPQILATSSIGMDTPRISINSSGFAVAVWQFNDGLSTSIAGATYTSSDGWSDTVTLSLDLGATSPQIAVSDTGDALATWAAFDGTYTRAEYSAYISSWSAPTFFPCSGHNAIEPRADTNALGKTVVSWRASSTEEGMNMIGAAKYTFGKGCSSRVPLSDPATASFSPDIAINDPGNALATWLFSANGGTTHQIGARYLNDETWSDPFIISEEREDNRPASVVINNANVGVAVWVSSDGVEEATFDSKTWGPATQVCTTATTNLNPDLSINNASHVYVAWTYLDDETKIDYILVSRGTLP